VARHAAGILALVAVALAACGSESERSAAPKERPAATLEEPTGTIHQPDCKPTGQLGDETLFLCWGRDSRRPGRFILVAGETQRPLEVPSPTRVGHWAWAKLSPDGETILAQWSAECEVPIAYLVPAAGGKPREAVPSYSSRALGWTHDGRAIVDVLESSCGPASPKPGIYLVDPEGATEGPFEKLPR
jgi:hypothetical protein